MVKKSHTQLLLQYLPFLVLYGVLVLILHDDSFGGDEERYFQFAENLSNGFYSPPPPNINLWSGPGYPIFLMPFVLLGLPLILITLFNAVFQYLSIVLLHLSLAEYVSSRVTTIISIFWGCYYISFQELGSMLTEPFSLFLITLFLYCFVQVHVNQQWKFVLGSGLVLGYLALTKIIFGYVILVMLSIAVLRFAFRNRLQLKYKPTQHSMLIFAIALLVNLPYLAYTYSLTGKYLYWANSGGSSLYWMSTPFEGEYGDWNNSTFTANCHDSHIPCNAALIAKNHQAEIDYILSLPKTKQDDAYKTIALQNISTHPTKFLRNIACNVSRLFFRIPISYYPQKDITLLRFPPNILLLVTLIWATLIWLLNVRRIPIEVNWLVIFTFTYLGGTSLLSAYPRMLYIIVPMILFWSGYVLSNSIKIQFKINQKSSCSTSSSKLSTKEKSRRFISVLQKKGE